MARVVKRVLSGMQPSGQPHLGNYLGALKTWVKLQDFFDDENPRNVLYMVADLHALTSSKDPQLLRENILDLTASLLACGVDPSKSTLFQQSAIAAHSELGWILQCNMPLGKAQQMTQFKDKIKAAESEGEKDYKKKKQQLLTVGLMAYPALMAADILLYQASHVPVGHDQTQHLELTQDFCRSLNNIAKKQKREPLFTRPAPIFPPNDFAGRIMSLSDGTKKMSKSDVLAFRSCINLTDSPDEIRKKLRLAKTDMEGVFDYVEHRRSKRPEIFNLLGIIAGLEGIDEVEVRKRYNGAGSKAIKDDVTDLLIETIVPIGEEMSRLRKDPAYLKGVLAQGNIVAEAVAQETLVSVKETVGLI